MSREVWDTAEKTALFERDEKLADFLFVEGMRMRKSELIKMFEDETLLVGT